MDLISEKFPNFAPLWSLYKLEYEISNEEITPFWGDTSFAGGMNKFSDYAIDLLLQKQQNPSLMGLKPNGTKSHAKELKF